MKLDSQYMLVVCPVNIIIRVPTMPHIPWRRVLKALTPILKTYGLRQKDIFRVEEMTLHETGNKEEIALRKKLDRAFRGQTSLFTTFDLYDWKIVDETFVLTRGATKVKL